MEIYYINSKQYCVIEVTQGEKFTLPNDGGSEDLYPTMPLMDFTFRAGSTYSIEDNGITEWLPDGSREVRRFFGGHFDAFNVESNLCRYLCEKFSADGISDGVKWGYTKNEDGQPVVEAQYDDATDLCAAETGAVRQGARWFFICARTGMRIDDNDYSDIAGQPLETCHAVCSCFETLGLSQCAACPSIWRKPKNLK